MHALLPLIAALGLFLGMANQLFQLPPLALLFPAVLYGFGSGEASPASVFRKALFSGILGYTACIYWVAVPLEEQAGIHWALAFPAPALLATYLALYAGLFALGIRLMRDRLSPVLLAVFAGLLWGTLELLRGTLFTGFPWAVLAAAFVPWPELLQPVSLMGSYAYSGILVMVVALLLETARSRRLIPAGIAAAILAACAGWILYAWQTAIPTTSPVRTTIVQGNIDQGQKWVPAYQNGTVHRYVDMTLGALSKAPADLVVWPETSMPFYLQEKKEYLSVVRDMVISEKTPLLVGTPAYAKGTEGRQWDTLNRAYLLTPDGLMNGWYDKEHLVPFGEYLPFGQYLPFLEVFFEGTGEFQTSAAIHPVSHGNLALGVLICYETIFPELAQQRVAEGANLLVNISNDAWFGNTAAPDQHLHLAVLRAIEQGRYLIRSTNTGISAIVDPKGTLIARSSLFRAETINGIAATVSRTTPYHNAYTFIHVLLAGACMLCIAIGMKRKKP
ncbi:apolipoprotein N-acyltransferase [Desulfovibrio mangrovi]|uniref:apolipoprotein N-acyltransferase n=1 Tax=Desulfovibrio mangrovi TaxID=2976983 RepID=UPI00224665BC|nr:apolipoprotein N-acyltransferase [Desulfovibrio mangrovi]UZP68200.1 apolipoprotein N-acyltransferase [Desulfovibrio mangrovi]